MAANVNGRRIGCVAVAVAIVAAVLLVLYLRRQEERADRAEAQLGLESARVLEATFERTSALQVSRLRGTMLVRSTAASAGGLVSNEQSTRAPFSVIYTLDLRRLEPSAYRWNVDTRTMTVDIPDVAPGPPAIDMARAKVEQKGLYISRTAGQQMQQQAAARLQARAEEEARKPENIAKAQEAARAAVAAFVRGPLAAANRGEVRVVVRLPNEARPPVMSQDEWDVSRSIPEIYALFGNGS